MNIYGYDFEVIDEDNRAGQLSVAKNSFNNEVLAFQLKNGQIPYLVFCGQNWDAALDNNLTWWAEYDGAEIYRLRRSVIQLAPPQATDRELTPPIRLSQGGRLSLRCDLNNVTAVPPGGGIVNARFRVLYAPVQIVGVRPFMRADLRNQYQKGAI